VDDGAHVTRAGPLLACRTGEAARVLLVSRRKTEAARSSLSKRLHLALDMPPIQCYILGASGMPLSGIRILLYYSGTEFEAYTSRAGIIDGWCHRVFTWARPDIIDADGWLHCCLTFSSVA